ncbi:hypothetical protein BDR06DRAFT_977475 [Suillus hirtellus]|nr:hypothetical protein BDR06DRAFT_977475 [Suillus hirtellus]
MVIESLRQHSSRSSTGHAEMEGCLLQFLKVSLLCKAAEIMLKASNEERGTVAGLTALLKDLNDAQVDAKHQLAKPMLLVYGTRLKLCPQKLIDYLLTQFVFDIPLLLLPLDCNTTFFDYMIIDGKRYHGSRTVGYNHSSFVHVAIPGPTATQHAYGFAMKTLLCVCVFGSLGSIRVETHNYHHSSTLIELSDSWV